MSLTGLMGNLIQKLDMNNWATEPKPGYVIEEAPIRSSAVECNADSSCVQTDIREYEHNNDSCQDCLCEEDSTPLSDNSQIIDELGEATPYKSKRMIIPGTNIFFIELAREIIKSNGVNKIPLMKEYNINSNILNEVLDELQDARVIDRNGEVLIDEEEFEHFIDIYNPALFDCKHGIFDKDIFMCMGEILFDKGPTSIYECMDNPDEVLDYIGIMENLNILSYDSELNTFNVLCDKQCFDSICQQIPNSYSSNHTMQCAFDDVKATFDTMSGIEFESFCKEVLTRNHFVNVRLTPPSGDHGIDILAEKEDILYAIQCKCYTSNVGNDAVQQAHTGKSLYSCDIAAVLTNQFFTQQATVEAKSLGVKLWDRNKLIEMIG